MTVSNSLKALAKVWAVKRPMRYGALRPGASPASKLVLALPRPLRTLYTWHDGLRDEHLALEEEFGWPSLKAITQSKRSLDSMEKQRFFEAWAPGSWWNAGWQPVLQFNLEDFLCVDVAGTLGEGRGAVFIRRNASPTRTVLASSFDAWLEMHLKITEAGPEGGSEEAWLSHFGSPVAKRLRKKVEARFPRKVEARQS